jgi:hypothetical protein
MEPSPFTGSLFGLLFILYLKVAIAQPNLATPEGSWAGSLQLPRSLPPDRVSRKARRGRCVYHYP